MSYMEIGLPDKLSLENHGDYIEIVRRWFGLKIVFLSIFAVLWDAFLLFWYSVVLSNANVPVMMLLIPLVHVAVGVAISYSALAGWLNRTHVLVSHEDLAIRHEPIPWLGGQALKSREIQQLYSKEVVSYSRNGRSVSYQLHAITLDGRNIRLVSGLESSEQALYMEQQIEKYLRIADRPVKGEIGGGNRANEGLWG